MQTSKQLLAMLALVSGCVAAQSITIVNKCAQTIYIEKTTADYDAETISLGPGRFIGQSLFNTGNSVGVALSSNFYATTTPKLIFGYTVNTDNGQLYYSAGSSDGNPFASLGFEVTGSNSACPSINSANGVTYACVNSSSLTLTTC